MAPCINAPSSDTRALDDDEANRWNFPAVVPLSLMEPGACFAGNWA